MNIAFPAESISNGTLSPVRVSRMATICEPFSGDGALAASVRRHERPFQTNSGQVFTAAEGRGGPVSSANNEIQARIR